MGGQTSTPHTSDPLPEQREAVEQQLESDIRTLMVAISRDDLAHCQEIVRNCGKEVITARKNYTAHTPLHFAVLNNRTRILQWFLDQQIPVNALNLAGNTALLCAVGKKSAISVQILLTAGANPAVRNEEGKTALELAMSLGADVAAITTMLSERLDQLSAIGMHTKPAHRESQQQYPSLQAAESAQEPDGQPVIVIADLSGSYCLAFAVFGVRATFIPFR
eukprot:m.79132 g.79132  ORF g.79132 m.79132 type:complete len:221 (+) comp50623_c0_seq7:2-664(+)